ncbi:MULTISPECIES: flagellar basal body-associated protein FliL [Bacillus]|uniref:flagellar basal body-associated protein FliL n=1 Tax=Bacillus TaxID=1386 RepID=UPI000BB7F01A|nr:MULTISPECIES: flagellar basal body-associated protein FliL [Bacillus]
MFQNKLVNTMLIILLFIFLLGIVVLVTVNIFYGDSNGTKEPSIDEVLKYSVDFNEITTNLQSGGYVRVQYKIQTDSNKARNELEKRNFQLENIVIHTIANKVASDFSGGEGIVELEEEIRFQLNSIMQDGKVVQVYTTRFLLQK